MPRLIGPWEERADFNRFSPQARAALSLAQEEARRLRHNYVGTVHLLLGIVRQGEGGAASVLDMLGARLARCGPRWSTLLAMLTALYWMRLA